MRKDKRVAAWRQARASHYALNLAPQTLAHMIVELEDEHRLTPEFELDDEWPTCVAHLKPKAGV